MHENNMGREGTRENKNDLEITPPKFGFIPKLITFSKPGRKISFTFRNVREIMRFEIIYGHMRNFIGHQLLEVFKNPKQKQRKLM
ncbi:hypothetical protein Y032_0101g3356 [Ancylostoma ceylanicum]|uniref:Uncharacterized protein n=1 Tax=Ancylostoma ceylanicum TaxID=53326 RepID=A0A016THN3_9BILA|nr:hypothetical protein Y032_0101g3356 [Ancylostoma ceylanicum]